MVIGAVGTAALGGSVSSVVSASLFRFTMKFRLLFFAFFTIYSIVFAQTSEVPEELVADFTYIMQAKPSKKEPNKHYKELFTLQVTNKQAYFASEVLAKRDSISTTLAKQKHIGNVMDFRGINMPRTRNNYVVIQNAKNVSFFQNVGMTLFYYENPVINKWQLKDETKEIETFVCKKAVLNYKGRDWVAWYCPEIALPYGPYKFSGLPGLIVQISDISGEYGFRLVAVKSSEKVTRVVNLNPGRYTNAKQTTQRELEDALQHFNENLANDPNFNGTLINVDSNFYRERRLKYQEYVKDFNPLEISD